MSHLVAIWPDWRGNLPSMNSTSCNNLECGKCEWMVDFSHTKYYKVFIYLSFHFTYSILYYLPLCFIYYLFCIKHLWTLSVLYFFYYPFISQFIYAHFLYCCHNLHILINIIISVWLLENYFLIIHKMCDEFLTTSNA